MDYCLVFFIKELAAVVKDQRLYLLVGDANPLRRSGMHSASAKRIGITDEQIQALVFYHRSQLFDEKDKAVIHFADQVTRAAATIGEEQLRELRKHFSEEQ